MPWITLFFALTWAAAQAGSIEVTVLRPSGDSAVFDEVEIAVAVRADEPIDRVELLVDDRRVASLREEPFRFVVDVGGENRPRRFTAVAFGSSGSMGSATVVTPAVQIDLELELSLQQLYVTATRDGEPALELQREDFSVFDDGVKQDLVTFERGQVPMTIALLVDVSESMRGRRLEAALETARGFMSRMTELDEVLVMVFSDRVHRLTASSTDLEELLPVLERLQSGGGTALNDHLYAAVRLLDGRQGRPVVILLSDGADTLSFLSMREVLWKTRRSNVIIFRIQVGDSPTGTAAFATAWQSLASSRAELDRLERAIDESGGRAQLISRIGGLEEALDGVLQELRQQYALGYYPSDPRHDGSWRPVRVEVAGPGVAIRTRAGYIDE